jgi:septal ring factor EnvC (AmiA/AmiB activator)
MPKSKSAKSSTPSSRDQLEAELIRIDRTLALDRKKLASIKGQIDELTDYRLTIEAKLARLVKPVKSVAKMPHIKQTNGK